MSYFQPKPSLVLTTMDEVRAAVENNSREQWKRLPDGYMWKIKSLWLIDLINEIESTGKYPYNSTVKQLAEGRMGFPPKSDLEYSQEGDTLSLLIYNAQCYRRSDDLISRGFLEATDTLLQEAFEKKRKIELTNGDVLTVRQVNGRYCAFKPRHRVNAVAVWGYPIRICS